jgi:lipopolysaccharide transport system ATP-binding protein
MSAPAIVAEQLGKAYTLTHRPQQQYDALRDVLADRLRAPWRMFARGRNGAHSEQFWALRDLSFSVAEGDVVGVIGRNGAGKSTLLKILSRITEPTTGSVRLRGRVGSLLEVGTGFHPELTGRENIYLNGAVLGMTRAEITRRFDDIVEFAEIERFLDTPVKRYSSGMYVRLAFAVAAHLEPEILVVDEVLAVGDAEFQRKCLGTMQRVSQRDGRTVLFVSHDMAAIEALCNRCILIDQGRLAHYGSAAETVSEYLRRATAVAPGALAERRDRQGTGNVRIDDVRIIAPAGIATGRPLTVRIRYHADNADVRVREAGLSIWNDRDVRLVSISSEFTGQLRDLPASGVVDCTIPSLPLVEGRYVLNVFVSSQHGLEDYVLRVADLVVSTGDFFGTGRSVHPEWGAVAVLHDWSLVQEPH